jgi:uncharacterized protein
VNAESNWRDQLRSYIAANANPPHKFGHQPRLYLLSLQIGEGLSFDDDIVFAAVWLHDLGVFIGHRPEDTALLKAWDHVAYTTAKAPALLNSFGFPAEKIPAVLEVIRTHQPQDEPQSLEAEIVRDADILEQLGAIGILRTISKVGSDNRFVQFGDAERSLARALEDLPKKIRLESTRSLASPKIALLRQFLAALRDEALEELG